MERELKPTLQSEPTTNQLSPSWWGENLGAPRGYFSVIRNAPDLSRNPAVETAQRPANPSARTRESWV
jgi:hypothetical protein